MARPDGAPATWYDIRGRAGSVKIRCRRLARRGGATSAAAMSLWRSRVIDDDFTEYCESKNRHHDPKSRDAPQRT